MTMRVSGLSTGMDYESWIKDLMKAEKVPINEQTQQKTLLEWKKEDYTTMYNSIKDFRENTVFNFKLSSSLSQKSASSSDSTVLSATANADAVNLSHTVGVYQLADGVKLTSSSAIGSKTDRTSLATQFGLTSDIDITINGQNITMSKDKSIYELVTKINNSGAGVKANYDATLDRFFLSSTTTGSKASVSFNGSASGDGGLTFLTDTLKLGDTAVGTSGVTSAIKLGITSTSATLSSLGLTGNANIKINNGTSSATIALDPTMTVQDFLDKVNNAGVNASAVYDSSTDMVTLKATSGTLDFSGTDDAGFSLLSNDLHLYLPSQGQDAITSIDGTYYTQASNSFTVAGVSYSLKAKGYSNVVISNDIDSEVKAVQSFVDSYNKILETVNKKLDEKYDRNYLPLTDDQKSSMKDTEITQWQAKARTGILRSDSALRSMVDKLRNDMSSPVAGLSGKYNNAAALGITTKSWTEEGKLYLDTAKLKKALQEDPDALSKVFGTTNSDNTASNYQGVAERMYSDLNNVLKQIDTTAGVSAGSSDTKSNLAIQIKQYTTRIKDLNTRAQEAEDRYYKEFSAMETALSTLNQQSTYLTNAFSSK